MRDPRFKVIPSEEELGEVDRDLRFYRACETAPQTLSAEEVSGFNKDGFVSGVPIFKEEEITEIRAYFDRLLEKVQANGGDSYSISSAHLHYGPVYDLLTHPRIVACVKDLLGESVIGWGAHFFCKMPRDPKAVAFHQDASYWPLSPSKTVTVWLAIDEADRENACMRFIRGSHWKGHLTYRPSRPEEHNVLSQTVERPEQYGETLDNCLRAGEISLHSDLLLHGSEPNASDRRRCALTLRYCTPDVRADQGWNAKGVVVAGEDPSGHWGNPSRPEAEV